MGLKLEAAAVIGENFVGESGVELSSYEALA